VTASKYAVISFAGAVLAGCALGMAANAQADCDPFLLSMTPQPVPACQAPDVAPPPDQPAIAPVNDVAMRCLPRCLPPRSPGRSATSRLLRRFCCRMGLSASGQAGAR